MSHVRIQHDTSEGGTEILFDIDQHPQTLEIAVTNIQLHSNYKTGLPESAYLEYNAGNSSWMLCHYYETYDKDKKIIKVREWLKSKLANDILAIILKEKEDQTPKFF